MPLLEQAMERGTAMGNVENQSLQMAWRGEAHLLAGRMDDARALVLCALDLSRQRNERGHQAFVLRLLGEIYSHHDPAEVEQAEAHYRQALALAEELGMRPLQAHCHLGLGRLYGQTGRAEQACTALSAAIDLYRAMDMTSWLPKTEAALAQVEVQS
jgi:tetratricopeptide (TPR) repeat protein